MWTSQGVDPACGFGGRVTGHATEKAGDAATCPGSRDCFYHPPAPAPGTLTYPCDNLMGWGSPMRKQLEGCLGSGTHKF